MRGRSHQSAVGPISASAGIGLRAPHYRDLLEQRPAVGWIEVHSENYFGLGGAPAHFLDKARERYPLSLHGVGLSLGSTDELSRPHLERLREVIARYEPWLVSDHLSWSSVEGRYYNDLLPLPYTRDVIAHVVLRIEQVQERLGRQILVENLSSYLSFRDGEMPEWEFVTQIVSRAGCGLLLDINNIYVASRNHGFDPNRYVDSIPVSLVQEMHLAGHVEQHVEGSTLLIDTHNQPVCESVWALYARAVRRFGPVPTLIEWDSDLPPLAELVAEAHRAEAILETRHALAA